MDMRSAQLLQALRDLEVTTLVPSLAARVGALEARQAAPAANPGPGNPSALTRLLALLVHRMRDAEARPGMAPRQAFPEMEVAICLEAIEAAASHSATECDHGAELSALRQRVDALERQRIEAVPARGPDGSSALAAPGEADEESAEATKLAAPIEADGDGEEAAEMPSDLAELQGTEGAPVDGEAMAKVARSSNAPAVQGAEGEAAGNSKLPVDAVDPARLAKRERQRLWVRAKRQAAKAAASTPAP